MKQTPFRVLFAVLATGFTLTTASACSSSSSESGQDSSPTSTSGESQVAPAITEKVAKYSEAPTSLNLTDEPLTSVPTGKTVYELEFPGPVGKAFGDAVVAACEPLGCEVERISLGASPDTITAAWDRAVNDKPDVVIAAGATKLLVGEQMKALQEAGVTVVVAVSDAVAPDDVNANVAPPEVFEFNAELQADWIAADSGGKADVVAYGFPDLPFLSVWPDAFEQELAVACPDCGFDLQDYTLAGAAQFPGQVVSYLQQHPDVNYVAMVDGDMMGAVHQAITAAGLDERVTFVTRAGTNLNYELITSGSAQKADIGFSMAIYGWGAIDAAARSLGDQEVTMPYQDVTQILTADNIDFDPKTTTSWSVEGYQDQFKASWGVE